jgi:hypothetical protein
MSAACPLPDTKDTSYHHPYSFFAKKHHDLAVLPTAVQLGSE